MKEDLIRARSSKASESCDILRAILIQATGSTASSKALEDSSTSMDPFMKDSGVRASDTAKESIHIQMGQNIQACFAEIRDATEESTNTEMAACMMESGAIMSGRALEL